jgi:hypothetical protein
MIACFLLPAGKSQSKSSDEGTGIRESISESSSSSEKSPETHKKTESSTPIPIAKEKVATESQSVSPDLADTKTKKIDQPKDAKVVTAITPALGLAALKSLIAKAAAGTLSSKSSVAKNQNETATKTDDHSEVSVPPNKAVSSVGKSTATTSTSTSTSTSTAVDSNDDPIQENDYWLEEKLKMQNTVAYQSFQKGALLKKTLTSKGTSPPPQTISTQVIIFPLQQYVTNNS